MNAAFPSLSPYTAFPMTTPPSTSIPVDFHPDLATPTDFLPAENVVGSEYAYRAAFNCISNACIAAAKAFAEPGTDFFDEEGARTLITAVKTALSVPKEQRERRFYALRAEASFACACLYDGGVINDGYEVLHKLEDEIELASEWVL